MIIETPTKFESLKVWETYLGELEKLPPTENVNWLIQDARETIAEKQKD